MANRSRAEVKVSDADVDLDSEKPQSAKKPRKRRKPAQRKRLRSGDDTPSNLAESPIEGDRLPPEEAVGAPEVGATGSSPGAAVPTPAGEPWSEADDEPEWTVSAPAAELPVPPTAAVVDSAAKAENESAKAADGNSGERAMDEDLKQHVKARETWIRLAYMILFGVVFYLGQFVVGLVAVVQFFHKLLTGQPHARLVAFGAEMAVFYREIVEFLAFHSERVPFPFSPWPRTAGSGSGSGPDAREVVHN